MENKNWNPSDIDRFTIIYQEFSDPSKTQKEQAPIMGVKYKAMNSWLNNQTKSINRSHKQKISEALGLDESIWEDSFKSTTDFCQKLSSYKKVNMAEEEIRHGIVKLLDLDTEMIEDEKISSIYEKIIQDEKDGNSIDALEQVEKLLITPSAFLLAHANEINFLYARLLASTSIQNFEKAIKILTSLYQNGYSEKEPEVFTLLYSNLKRKLFFTDDEKGFRNKEEIDVEKINEIAHEYKKKYERGTVKTHYYDALNYAYMYNLYHYLKEETFNRKSIVELYNILKKRWSVNENDWWEVISQSEFLMLTGDILTAKRKVDNFLDFHKVTESQKLATLRQLELYIHFTEDKSAIEFYKHLKESLKYSSL